MGNKGHSEPKLFGGMNHYDEHGNKIGHSEPRVFGGYTNYDAKGRKIGYSDPGFFGGMNHYDAHGNKTGHSDPGLFGGYTHYDQNGKKSGSSDPGFFNSYSHNDSSGGCYIATCVYGSYDCPSVWTLRRYRDYQLSKTIFGQLFIKIYYKLSPLVVASFGSREWFRKFWIKVLDKKVMKLKEKGYLDTPYQDR